MELCYYAHIGVYSNICYRTAFNRVMMHGNCDWLLYLWNRISFLPGEKACSRRRAVCAGCCSRLLACDLVWMNCCLFIHDVFEVQAVFEDIDAAENGCISVCEAGASEVGYIFLIIWLIGFGYLCVSGQRRQLRAFYKIQRWSIACGLHQRINWRIVKWIMYWIARTID